MTGVAVDIRRLDPEEWSTYRAVRLAALRDAPEAFGGTYAHSAAYDERRWRDWCAQPSWFAFNDGEPVGMVRVAQLDGDRNPSFPELISMWVAPRSRGTAAATGLVRHVLDWAREERHDGVTLRVIETNSRARSFYERVGFVDDGSRHILPDGRSEIGMTLEFA